MAQAAVLTSFGTWSTGYYSLASAVWLVDQHMGEQLNQLQAFWSQCMAKVTATDFLRDLTLNFGLGLAFEGVDWLLEDAEEGASALCELCFAAGTPVQTDHGSVPIERIKVGDKVSARNAGTGKNEMQPVTAIAPQHRHSRQWP